MSQIRTILSVALLWLLVCSSAAAVEVLPMDSVEPACEDTRIEAAIDESSAVTRAEPVEVIVEAAEAPAGLQSVGGSAPVQRANGAGGGDSSTPPAAKPSSRWNAFLPGMVR